MKLNGFQVFSVPVFLGLLLLSLVPSAFSAEYFVSPEGGDAAGAGTLASPFATPGHALDQADAGDTITLRRGIYHVDGLRIENPNTTLRSYPGEWAILRSPIGGNVTVEFRLDSSGSKLHRLEIMGGYYSVMTASNWDWGDPVRYGASNIVIQDCKIHDSADACIKVTPGSDNITIRRCEIYNSGRTEPGSAEGIDNVNGDRLVVQDCYIHDIEGSGLYAKGGARGMLVERCLIVNCSSGGVLVGFDTSPEWFDVEDNPDYYESIDAIVRNNVIVNTRYAGIGMYAAKNATVQNNTLVGVARDGHAGLYFGLTYQDWEPDAGRPPSVNPVLRNNIVVQSGTDNSSVVAIRYDDELGGMHALSGMPTMSNNRYFVDKGRAFFSDDRPGTEFEGGLAGWKTHISGDSDSTEGDPGFVDAPNQDYHLKASSPCIDSGTPEGSPASDFDKFSRPRGKGYDIGAFEYRESGDPVPDIRANGFNRVVTVAQGTPVFISIGLGPGKHTSESADWWIFRTDPLGRLKYLDISALTMVRGFAPTYQGGLFAFPLATIMNISDLPPGPYVFYFGVDMDTNGRLDEASLYYDYVVVMVNGL